MEQIHTESPDKGYRRIKDDLAHDHKINVNEKRVLRICRSLDIKSTIKYKNNGCTRQADNPQHIAKNWLNRQFQASMPAPQKILCKRFSTKSRISRFQSAW